MNSENMVSDKVWCPPISPNPEKVGYIV